MLLILNSDFNLSVIKIKLMFEYAVVERFYSNYSVLVVDSVKTAFLVQQSVQLQVNPKP